MCLCVKAVASAFQPSTSMAKVKTNTWVKARAAPQGFDFKAVVAPAAFLSAAPAFADSTDVSLACSGPFLSRLSILLGSKADLGVLLFPT